MEHLLKILLVCAFLNASSWIILTPVWQYPDEQAHFAQIQDMAELGSVPPSGPNTSREIALSEKILGTERDGLGNNKFTYHPEYRIDYSQTLIGPQEMEITNLFKGSRKELIKSESTQNPPLYYFLAAFIYRIFSWGDLFTRVYAIRFLSVVFFMATIYLTHKTANEIFKNQKLLSIFLTSLVAFNPMFVYVSTGIFPDPLTNLLFTYVLYISIKILKIGLDLRNSITLTIAIILGILTRQQFLIAALIAAIPIGFHFFKKPALLSKSFILSEQTPVKNLKFGRGIKAESSEKENTTDFSPWKFIIILPAILVIFIASAVFPSLSFFRGFPAPEIGTPNISLLFSEQFVFYLKEFIKLSIAQTLPWYWGVYKWLSLTLPPLDYQLINRLLLASSFGLIIYFVKSLKIKKFSQEQIIVAFLIFASFIYFLLFAIWDFYFRNLYKYPFGFQGRYFFPLIVAHFTIIFVGLKELVYLLLKKHASYALYLIVFLMFIFNVHTITFISTSYYDSTSIRNFVIQASQYKPEIFKGNILYVVFLLSLTSQSLYLFLLFKNVQKLSE